MQEPDQNTGKAADLPEIDPSEPAPPGGSPEPSAELLAAQAKAEEAYESFLRAKAEIENIRRRAQDDIAKARKFGIESFAEGLVPVYDSLEAALADPTADVAKLREGVELTLRQLATAFEKNRLIPINPLGEKFDPHLHQAISTQPAPDLAPNHVVSVLQKGWVIADRVLRPALVTVSHPA
jgi:molecular chaperone GrpE